MSLTLVAGVLLAAGESSRMGSPKPLLPWLGKHLVAYQVEQMLAAGVSPLVVVVGHEAEKVEAALVGYPAVVPLRNPLYLQGKASSIRAGVAAVKVKGVGKGVLIQAVDQPRRAETLQALVAAHLEGKQAVTIPTFRGRGGHPAVFSANLVPELLTVDEETQGLRRVVSGHRDDTKEVPFETREVLFNLNTTEEYHLAQAYFRRRGR